MTQHIREFLHDDSRTIPARVAQLRDIAGVSDLVRQLLEESWQRQDWDTFELAVIAAFDHPNAGMTDLLCTALESGPRATPVEDILEVLGEIKDPRALGTLRRVLDNPPDWDEFHHTSVKSVWAIAATGTPEARDILEVAQRTGPDVVREWAGSKLHSWPGQNELSTGEGTVDGQDEVRRILRGSGIDEAPQGAELMHFHIRCNGNAEQVLHRSQEVLLALFRHHPGREVASLRQGLPGWFLEACAPAETPAQVRARLAHRRALPRDQQLRQERDDPWSLEAWLHWFTDEERLWSWWTARVTDPDSIDLTLAITDWPAPMAALEWIFRAAGSTEIESDG